MKLIDKNNKITIKELEEMAGEMFGDLVKAVVDIEQVIMVVDAELHVDEESFLLEKGASQNNLWGINLYPKLVGTKDFVEFDSMINLRPSQNNRSRGVENKEIRIKILDIVTKLVKEK